MDMQAFNEQIIEEFRANGGKVAMFAEHPMVILHTVGAKSGAVRLIPLVLTESDDERILFASFAGSKKDPAWGAQPSCNARDKDRTGGRRIYGEYRRVFH